MRPRVEDDTDQLTIYLDGQEGKRAKWFWWVHVAVGVSWILQGVLGVYAPPSKLPFWPWISLFGGIVFLCVVLIGVLLRHKYGRMRLVFSDMGLAVKTRELGSAEEIRWEDVASMQFGLNQVDIMKKEGTGDPIPIKLGSYALNQQVKEALAKSAAERGLEIRA